MSNTDEKPSEPKIDANAMRALLAEQEKRLLDGFGRILRDERNKHNSFIGGLLRWVASQLEKK